MILAAYRDNAYDLVLFLHILTVIVAFAPAVVHPILITFEQRRPEGDVQALAARIVAPGRVYAIALALTGILGMGLISMSDDVISWGDTWIWLSILLWIVLQGVLHGLMLPAERAVASGDESAVRKLDTFGPILGVLAVVLIYLMVFKPGGGGL